MDTKGLLDVFKAYQYMFATMSHALAEESQEADRFAEQLLQLAIQTKNEQLINLLLDNGVRRHELTQQYVEQLDLVSMAL